MFRHLRDWSAYLRHYRRRAGRRDPKPLRRRAFLCVEPLEERRLFSIGVTNYLLPTHNTHVLGIAAGPDGNLWFTENAAHQIGSIAPSGSPITEYGLGSAYYPSYITQGPDGNLWFTETNGGPSAGNGVAKSTTAGIVTHYFLDPAAGSYMDVGGITTGPDGNLWMTAAKGTGPGPNYTYEMMVDQIATSGGATEYTVDTDTDFGAGPTMGGITVGPDGNLWFAETDTVYDGGKVGKITPAGSVTLYRVNGHPYGITAGPDGNLWFTLEDTNQIGRITTAGALTYWNVPTANSTPKGITLGPDGNLWFAEWNVNQVTQFVLSSHTFNEIGPAGSAPDGITVGPDNDIWFTLSGSDHVGKLTDILGAYVRYDDPPTEGCTCGANAFISLNTGDLRLHVPLDPGAGAAAGAGLRPDTALDYRSDTVTVYPIVEVHYETDPNGSVPTQFQAQLTWNNGTAQPWVTFTTTGHSAGDTYVLDAQSTTLVTASGTYPFQVEVKASYQGGGLIDRTYTGSADVVANGTSDALAALSATFSITS